MKFLFKTLQKISQFHLFSWCGNFVERRSFDIVSSDKQFSINLLLVKAPILYPLKVPEKQRFSSVSSGCKMERMARTGPMSITKNMQHHTESINMEFLTKIVNNRNSLTIFPTIFILYIWLGFWILKNC